MTPKLCAPDSFCLQLREGYCLSDKGEPECPPLSSHASNQYPIMRITFRGPLAGLMEQKGTTQCHSLFPSVPVFLTT